MLNILFGVNISTLSKPSTGSQKGQWEKIEQLIIRDCKIQREALRGGASWSRIIRDLPEEPVSAGSPSVSPLSPQGFQVSEELVRAIKKYLGALYFRAKFSFKGSEMEEILLLPLS